MTPHSQHRFSARAPRRGRAGWTLIELLITLAIGGVLIALSMPSYHDWIADSRLENHARNLAQSMQMARSEAIKRGYRVNLCKSADRRTCTDVGTWDGGFLVWGDVNHDGNVDIGEPLIYAEGPAPEDVRVRANAPVDDYVSYTWLGQARLLNGALQMGTLRVCSSGRRELDVVLANSGRVRVQKTAIICP